jgi:hypothetical protein
MKLAGETNKMRSGTQKQPGRIGRNKQGRNQCALGDQSSGKNQMATGALMAGCGS